MRAVAGGKVVLLGEYAVLDGAPAWVAAVDRGVQCIVDPAQTLIIDTPADDRYARAALEAVHAPPARYRFSDWRPVDAPTKVGLGGSAAATVAAVVAGSSAAGRHLAAPELHHLAQAVHHQVQGSGSGIDVAASAYGGVLQLAGNQVTPGPPVVPTVVFSGTSASTGPRVQRYLAWGDRASFVQDSRALAAAFPDDPARVLGAAGQRLRTMAEAARIPYWTPGIDAIVRLAQVHGGAAKPSGAGGGDIVVALFDDPDARAAFVRAVAAAGLLHIPVSLAAAAHLDSRR